ncbi:BED-type domain-containing protein [Meloidogyne graminicola]|uniref:BED-type domain-containing protein n=1 Tax=Meloidogyne graminicola TaxID=189291 RepID=A0A8S9ZJI6_9BILA|nr:BED-type domain-containing protein [Meloidogyne graminicola]
MFLLNLFPFQDNQRPNNLQPNKYNLGIVQIVKQKEYLCFFCLRFLKGLKKVHYERKGCTIKEYYNEENWSLLFDEINGKPVNIKPLLNIVQSEEGDYKVYIVRSVDEEENIKSLIYCGVTKTSLKKRFYDHRRKRTFEKFKVIKYALLYDKLSKLNGELLEGLLIYSAMLQTNMLNKKFENEHILSVIKYEPMATFQERFFNFLKQSFQLLKNKWEEIEERDWIEMEVVKFLKTKQFSKTTKDENNS